MSNNEKTVHPPRRGPMGGPRVAEKSKDFKGAVKRLFSELGHFKILIVIALILAILSSILSILAPNQLSKITDTISEGLVINKENMQELTTKVSANMQTGNMQDIEIDGKIISLEDQQKAMKILSSMTEDMNPEQLYEK